MKKLLLFALLCIAQQRLHAQTGALEVWIRAFIPDPVHAGQAAAYIKPIPHGTGSLISVLTYCFKTDHRGFSSDPAASSRLETRFLINPTSATTAAILPAAGRSKAGTTFRLDCTSGAVIASKAGKVDRDAAGTPAVADGIIQVIGQATGTNIMTLAGDAGPAIDYSWDIQWNSNTSKLVARINYGSFPAFELYVRKPGGNWVTIINAVPSKTPSSLAGDAFGLNTEVANVNLTILEYKEIFKGPFYPVERRIIGTHVQFFAVSHFDIKLKIT